MTLAIVASSVAESGPGAWVVALGAAATVGVLGALFKWSWPHLKERILNEEGFASVIVCFSLTAWFLVGVVLCATAADNGMSETERVAVGAIIDVHYFLSWIDRQMRPLNAYAQYAPLFAAVAAAAFVVAPGNFIGGGLTLLAIAVYQYGYIRSRAFGRYTICVVMSLSASVGDILCLVGVIGFGELLLVIAGFLAGLRSVIAIVSGQETRAWTNRPRRDGSAVI